mmetsp:Transcript_21681/g.64975  ORF Transcript_21681/g.64975 Transcript_21681/m.64975 type:complete len:245 (+) Transcript_21681:190-924(+)|eukprot:CAMPEP_0119295848 /NCGR_PEP_ID=MMETSP1329-20130426/50269_1 /TAXON_ID=114041 /ORGANISM="Genus nov. species nov., Strain RCC1024" /LENGTH=244 /DNA_ID=CAMNT_0007296769 /DNA_START=669 /DNA_END=1403 /DNA_ORIENTATION=-
MTFLRTIAALSLFGAARAEKCEAGKQDLHVFLYDGSVRDMDPSFFDGQSDAFCLLSVESDERTEFLSDIRLNSNNPEFNMFFEFGCHPVDSLFEMTCYDWDPDNFEVDDAEVVFAANAVATWPESGVRSRLVDATAPIYFFDYKMIYGSDLDADGLPSSGKKKKSSGRELTDAIAIAVGACLVALAFALGVFCCRRRAKQAPAPPEVVGVELADVEAVTSAPTRTAGEPTKEGVPVSAVQVEGL